MDVGGGYFQFTIEGVLVYMDDIVSFTEAFPTRINTCHRGGTQVSVAGHGSLRRDSCLCGGTKISVAGPPVSLQHVLKPEWKHVFITQLMYTSCGDIIGTFCLLTLCIGHGSLRRD